MSSHAILIKFDYIKVNKQLDIKMLKLGPNVLKIVKCKLSELI